MYSLISRGSWRVMGSGIEPDFSGLLYAPGTSTILLPLTISLATSVSSSERGSLMVVILPLASLTPSTIGQQELASRALWHRPRGLGPMEPGKLAGGVRCPPTSLWWAMENPETLARRGLGKRPSGGCGGCCNRLGKRSCTVAATTGVLVDTARSDGIEYQK
jgi:hypothetical protein